MDAAASGATPGGGTRDVGGGGGGGAPPEHRVALQGNPKLNRPRRAGWSPEFVDFALYAFFLAVLCTSNVASSSSAPYYMRRNLEDLFLVNEFESNVAYEGIASHSQIRVWMRDIVVGYAFPETAWTGGSVSSPRFLADDVTLRVGPIRLRVVRVAPDSCHLNRRLANDGKLPLEDCYAPYTCDAVDKGNFMLSASSIIPYRSTSETRELPYASVATRAAFPSWW